MRVRRHALTHIVSLFLCLCIRVVSRFLFFLGTALLLVAGSFFLLLLNVERAAVRAHLRVLFAWLRYAASLAKMFGNGRARSGMIVLPCGAGKTLVGITAMATIKKSCLIFCSTSVAVDQWKRQIEQWTTLPPGRIRRFTAAEKEMPQRTDEAVCVITTYNMLSYQVSQKDRRSRSSEAMFQFLRTHQWGLVILDEVQVAPAQLFRSCVRATHSMCKLGLTATLVREDNLIEDLYFLVGESGRRRGVCVCVCGGG